MSQLKMEKKGLSDLPEIAVPEGYVLRHFQPGDEAGMGRVYEVSELGNSTVEAVRKTILENPCFRPERVLIIEHEGDVVGTAAAWLEPREPEVGYLHMVGVLPEHRGRQLGKILTVAAMAYSRDEGFEVQRLVTDDWRDGAVHLYLDLGYDPLLTDSTHRRRWEKLAQRLNRPDILERARELSKPATGGGLVRRLFQALGF